MSKRRKALKDLSTKHLKRIALEEAKHDLNQFSDTDSDSSNSDFSYLKSQSNVPSTSIQSNCLVTSSGSPWSASDDEVSAVGSGGTVSVGGSTYGGDNGEGTSEYSICNDNDESTTTTTSECSSSDSIFINFSLEDNASCRPNDICSPDKEVETPPSLKTKLNNWAVNNKVPNQTLSELLKILKSEGHPDLPADARTLLSTPRATLTRNVLPGAYWHAGIKYNLTSIDLIKSEILKATNIRCIEIAVGIDGLPISKSSGSCLWPILGRVVNIPVDKTFIIGVYHGNEKPLDSNEFLKDFIDETIELSQSGLAIGNKVFEIKIKYIICDAPAKAFILKVKGHAGYGSCTKCTVNGQFSNGRVCFFHLNNIRINPRKDTDYFEVTDETFHLGSPDLKKIPNFGLVSNIPLDYMHLVCLGVMKKLIFLWMFGDKRLKKKDQVFKINSNKIDAISTGLESLKPFVPKEFARKPRSLKEIKMWKATEYRQLLLYTGVVILKEALPAVLYEHFLCLHIGIRILCSPDFCVSHLSYAKEILRHFVTCFGLIYGKHNISHNVHGLIHLCDDVEQFGPLDKFSAFPFENEMQIIKKKLRKFEKPLQQLSRRYFEENNSSSSIDVNKPKLGIDLNSVHHEGPIINDTKSPQYKIYNLKQSQIISDSKADSVCLLSDGAIVKVLNIAQSVISNEPVIIGQEFKQTQNPVFNKPCDSSIFETTVVEGLSQDLKHWPIEKLKSKLFVIPYNGQYVAIPVMHNSRM